MVYYSVFFTISILLSEFCFRLSSIGKIGGFTFFLPIFSVLAGCMLGLLCSALPKKAGNAVSYVISVLLFFFYSVKLIYQHIFKSYLSVSQVGMGGDAIKSFTTETFIGAGECIGYIAVLLAPCLFLIVMKLRIKKAAVASGKNIPDDFGRLSVKQVVLTAALLLALQLSMPLGLTLLGTETYSPEEIYTDTFILAMSEKYFGALTTTRLEIRNIFFKQEGPSIVDGATDVGNGEAEGSENQSESGKTNTGETEKTIEYGKNELDLDFTKDGTEEQKSLNNYFSSCTATKKNAYTGKFRDYNLIILCCESFSPYLLDEERTPLLYKMSQSGIVFNDYYDTICDNTSNSEYVLLTGMLPDTSLLGKGWETFYEYNSCTASKKNYLPFTLANQFKNEGVKSMAFHNYWGNYYGRNETHKNFGYDFKSMNHGLRKVEGMPTSDLEMMEQAMPQLLTPDESGNIPRFNAYFMTFSGHMQYRFDTNLIAAKNREISEALDVSNPVKAYVSCNQELEYAVEYMMEKLEEAGIADNTLIVLTQDHYPYTLGMEKLSELAGSELGSTEFDSYINQYKGTLIIWSPSMKERTDIDFPVCELDILPTLSNLFGFSFDSRFMMGCDVFSDGSHYAVLEDRGFVTENFYYCASNNSIISRTGEEPDSAVVQRYIDVIKNKFTVSNQVLYSDYFRYLLCN